MLTPILCNSFCRRHSSSVNPTFDASCSSLWSRHSSTLMFTLAASRASFHICSLSARRTRSRSFCASRNLSFRSRLFIRIMALCSLICAFSAMRRLRAISDWYFFHCCSGVSSGFGGMSSSTAVPRTATSPRSFSAQSS
ncbi:hypothetical protein ABW21_db0208258 [Orbilia brochopaga]|nr:hypothetical protein ABW21_db0208258 [Drechslerella brochopaga]